MPRKGIRPFHSKTKQPTTSTGFSPGCVDCSSAPGSQTAHQRQNAPEQRPCLCWRVARIYELRAASRAVPSPASLVSKTITGCLSSPLWRTHYSTAVGICQKARAAGLGRCPKRMRYSLAAFPSRAAGYFTAENAETAEQKKKNSAPSALSAVKYLARCGETGRFLHHQKGHTDAGSQHQRQAGQQRQAQRFRAGGQHDAALDDGVGHGGQHDGPRGDR